MKISEILKRGTIHYGTAWGFLVEESSPPKNLETLAEKCPDAEIIQFGDETIGIDVDGLVWACEDPHSMRGKGPQKRLGQKTWEYIRAAMETPQKEFALVWEPHYYAGALNNPESQIVGYYETLEEALTVRAEESGKSSRFALAQGEYAMPSIEIYNTGNGERYE